MFASIINVVFVTMFRVEEEVPQAAFLQLFSPSLPLLQYSDGASDSSHKLESQGFTLWLSL
jgi:hypothetical protein